MWMKNLNGWIVELAMMIENLEMVVVMMKNGKNEVIKLYLIDVMLVGSRWRILFLSNRSIVLNR